MLLRWHVGASNRLPTLHTGKLFLLLLNLVLQGQVVQQVGTWLFLPKTSKFWGRRRLDLPQLIFPWRKVKSNLPPAINHRRDLCFLPQDRFSSSVGMLAPCLLGGLTFTRVSSYSSRINSRSTRTAQTANKEKMGWDISLLLSILSY